MPSPGDAFVDQQDAALALLCNGRVGRALDLDREDPRLVDRYGRHLFGRSLLMARRLVEAGVPIVQATMGIVQTWDTHVANFPRLKDDLLPAARPRGLGPARRPGGPRPARRDPGRDARRVRPDAPDLPADPGRRAGPRPLAGGLPGRLRRRRGGRRPGHRQVRPARGLPLSRTFGPPDLAATIYSALGVDPATELRDRLGRPLRLCSGEVMTPLYTTAPV